VAKGEAMKVIAATLVLYSMFLGTANAEPATLVNYWTLENGQYHCEYSDGTSIDIWPITDCPATK
jgi:hypothetical protein